MICEIQMFSSSSLVCVSLSYDHYIVVIASCKDSSQSDDPLSMKRVDTIRFYDGQILKKYDNNNNDKKITIHACDNKKQS